MQRASDSDRIKRLVVLAIFIASPSCKASLSKTSASSHRSVDSAAETAGGVPPRIYVAKVKNLLTGQPATQEEVDAVTSDRSAMNGLVRQWLVTPEGKAATLAFFRNSFQQAQTPITDFTTVLGNNMEGNLNTPDAQLIEQEFYASFENTAWELAVNRSQPFNSLWKTRTFWATTAMLSMMLYTDGQDAGGKNIYDEAYGDELANMYITSNDSKAAGKDADGHYYWHVTSGAGATTSMNNTNVQTVTSGNTIGPVNCGLPGASGVAGAAQIQTHPGGPNANGVAISDYTDSVFELLIGFAVPVEQPSQQCYKTPQPVCAGVVSCPLVNPESNGPWDLSYGGSAAGQTFPYPSQVTVPAKPVPIPAFRVKTGQFTAADHTDWRLVTTRDLAAGEKPVRFWDLATLRSASEANVIPTRIQRVGPFTTPAFLANWTTNANNQSRSTANQMLIISVGGSFDGTNTSVLSSQSNAAADTTTSLSNGETASDAAHASNAACQSCHVSLDPLRKFYSKNLTYGWAPQNDASFTAATPFFNFGGVQTAGSSFVELGNVMANHPSLAPAWVQKACYWINSSPCSDSDPEFLAISQSFASTFDFTTMIADLLSAPMITNASDSYTQEDQGEVLSISRLDHLCKTLAVRLSLASSFCNSNPNGGIKNGNGVINAVTQSIPTDGYTRGATEPFQPAQPGLFFRAATENFCVQIAPSIVDAAATATAPAGPYTSGSPSAAIGDMVHNLMGILPSDPREPDVLRILSSHYTKAVATGSSPTTALRSTFVVACTSPAVISIGL